MHEDVVQTCVNKRMYVLVEDVKVLEFNTVADENCTFLTKYCIFSRRTRSWSSSIVRIASIMANSGPSDAAAGLLNLPYSI